MSTINDLPNPSTFGEDFNYAAWVPNSTVQLCNVPWNSDYRDIVNFNAPSDLANYCKSRLVYELSQLTYLKIDRPIRLNIPFNQLLGANYVRVINPNQPVSGTYTDSNNVVHTVSDVSRDLYYFITNINYLAPNTTELTLQLDVWQTFKWNVKFGQCYIERGHIGIANENQMVDGGREYLTIPEGLDIGSDYTIPFEWQSSVGGLPMGLIITATDFISNPGTISSPNLNTSKGSSVHGIPSGCDYWYTSLSGLDQIISGMQNYPWISQGIIGIYLVPNVTLVGDSHTSLLGGNLNFVGGASATRLNDNSPGAVTHVNITEVSAGSDWRSYISNKLPSRYQFLKKFLTAPYTLLEYTSYGGTPFIANPECLPVESDLYVHQLYNFLMPGGRLTFVPAGYNDSNSDSTNVFGGEYLDAQTVIVNFPSTNIVNSGAIEWLAANHANLSYSKQSANWAQQKALNANNAALTNSNFSIANMQAQAMNTIHANSLMNDLNNTMGVAHGVMGALTSGVSGLMEGGPIAALAGVGGSAINTGLGVYANDQRTNIQNQLTGEQNKQNILAASGIRDTNKLYSDFAAKGDYANEIAGIQAQVQSAQMIEPSVVGQVGGDSFQYLHAGFYLYVKVKMLQSGHIKQVGEFWLRYGYAIQQFVTPPANLACMSKFTYWKMRETYLISTTLPEFFKQTIRGIFEKGVTVWQNPDDIGTVDMGTNTPLSGIVLP